MPLFGKGRKKRSGGGRRGSRRRDDFSDEDSFDDEGSYSGGSSGEDDPPPRSSSRSRRGSRGDIGRGSRRGSRAGRPGPDDSLDLEEVGGPTRGDDSLEEVGYKAKTPKCVCCKKFCGAICCFLCRFPWAGCPSCIFNPFFCENILHILTYLVNLIAFVLFLIHSIRDSVSTQSTYAIGSAASQPAVIVLLYLFLLPVGFVLKHWAAYLGGTTLGMGDGPDGGMPGTGRSSMWFAIYVLSSFNVLGIHLYSLVGFSGGVGVYALYRSIEVVVVNPEPSWWIYNIVMTAFAGISTLLWFLSIILSIYLMFYIWCQCCKAVSCYECFMLVDGDGRDDMILDEDMGGGRGMDDMDDGGYDMGGGGGGGGDGYGSGSGGSVTPDEFSDEDY